MTGFPHHRDVVAGYVGPPRSVVFSLEGAGGVNVWTLRGLITMTMFAVVTTSVPIAHAQAPVTLQAAVESALSQHPSVAAAQQALVAAQARLAQAQAGQNIQIVLSAGSSYGNAATIPPGGATGTNTSATVSASLLLVN